MSWIKSFNVARDRTWGRDCLGDVTGNKLPSDCLTKRRVKNPVSVQNRASSKTFGQHHRIEPFQMQRTELA